MIDANTLASAVHALTQAAPQAEQIILFGSQVRGDAVEGSDWDFLVIEPEVENRAQDVGDGQRAVGPGQDQPWANGRGCGSAGQP